MFRLLFSPLENMLVLKGRARRMEYFVFYMACYLLVSLPATLMSEFIDRGHNIPFSFLTIFSAIGVITVIASCTLTVRRLHDIGWSGWWLWLIIIIWPLAFILFFVKGDEGPNRFGLPPVEDESNQ